MKSSLKLILFLTVFAGSIARTLAQQPIYEVTIGNGNGIRFWQSDWFKMHMGNTSEYRYGPVTDYSIKMNTDGNAGRGWTWGISGQTPVAALNNAGQMQISGAFISGGIRIPNRFAFSQSESAVEIEVPTGSYNAFRGYNGTQHIGTIHFFDDTWGSGLPSNSAGSINLTPHTAVTIGTWSNPIAYFRQSDGNVGIGTAEPTSKLDVRGGIVSKNNSGNQFSLQTDGIRWDFDVDVSSANNLRLRNITAGTVPLTVATNGNVGIGTAPTTEKLTVGGGGIALDADQPIRGGGRWLISGNNSAVTVGTANPGIGLRFMAGDNTPRMYVDAISGGVGIGTPNTGSYKLAVEGKIGAREVNVTTTAWSDYVFNSDYKLRPLSEVQQFINKNHHLPEVPSEKDVLANGQNLGEMNAILLKKIEELTLYVIELKNENDTLKQRVEKIENENK